MDVELKIVLPPAPPDDYLRWIAFCRELEQKMLAHPPLEAMADEQGIPFLRGLASVFFSDVVATEIGRQALVAKRAGDAFLAPTFEASVNLIAETANLLERRALWLRENGATDAMGLDPLQPELMSLWASIIHVIRWQLGKVGPPVERRQVPAGSEEFIYDIRCPCCQADLREPPRFLRRAHDLYCGRCMWVIPVSPISQRDVVVIDLTHCPTHPRKQLIPIAADRKPWRSD